MHQHVAEPHRAHSTPRGLTEARSKSRKCPRHQTTKWTRCQRESSTAAMGRVGQLAPEQLQIDESLVPPLVPSHKEMDVCGCINTSTRQTTPPMPMRCCSCARPPLCRWVASLHQLLQRQCLPLVGMYLAPQHVDREQRAQRHERRTAPACATHGWPRTEQDQCRDDASHLIAGHLCNALPCM